MELYGIAIYQNTDYIIKEEIMKIKAATS